ncbi:DUF3164 family protein [Luteimonas terricola]|uniref:Sulfate transporter n=1 Tax=Luteimonas terricola TaxID=645597 RepID=A0ABQ2EIQ5_9GAMM|nr:DUF3164 family protein [Luteimonas terricola]GGK08815.1 sulfate transporter [Luteimonas terricola]
MKTTDIPAGHRKDHMGRLVPEKQIKAIDLARDELVREIVAKAKAQSDSLAAFKRGAFEDVDAFVDLSAEQYGVRLGGKKGNVSLRSFDGRFRVLRAIAENITFDERLKAAKALIDECLKEWSEGAAAELQTIVQDAFRVDQEGNIRIQQVLGLRRLNIEDERWQRAMTAIGDAIQVVGSRSYIRVYERVGETQYWSQIPLDVSAVPL